MPKIFPTAIVSLALCGLALQAGEVGLLYDTQLGQSQVVAAAPSVQAGNYDAIKPTAYGFRVGTTLLDLKVIELDLTATYHPSVTGNVVVNGTTTGTYSNQYAAVGAQLDWSFLLNIHAAIEMRAEKMSTTISGTSSSTTLTRPWIGAGAGFSLPTPVISPFIRLEVAKPLKQNSGTSSLSQLQQTLAPVLQIGLYAGIHF